MTARRDVVIIGGGHNGLAAAAYLARAGLDVEVLERLDDLGGAAVSAQAFPGVDARLSRYSYLVSLLPQRIIDDLGLRISLAPRRYSSYTPVPGGEGGLLVDNHDAEATAASFASIGATADAGAWTDFYEGTGRLARALFPTVTDPLLTRAEARAALGDDRLWDELIEQPIGQTIADRFGHDLVRGVAYTDALIGTFAPNVDATLNANRCFLYHVIGGGTGDWNVPVGGMGAVTGELSRAARLAGATLTTGADVTALDGDRVVTYLRSGEEHRVAAEYVLVNASPRELNRLLAASRSGDAGSASVTEPPAEGAQVKVNLLLKRLPRLRDESLDPAAAFGGTFHINETFAQLQAAFDAASAGSIPDPVPAEIYCHSLTDPSILSPDLQAAGAQTLTVFALHTPDRLLSADNELTSDNHDGMRDALQAAVLASLNSVLAEPVESLLMLDGDGQPCIETKTTRDLEDALRLPGGSIFHGDLDWPWAEDGDALASPAERWGVATGIDGVLLCGAGAQRGGAVSAIGGHNAAMAVLETL